VFFLIFRKIVEQWESQRIIRNFINSIAKFFELFHIVVVTLFGEDKKIKQDKHKGKSSKAKNILNHGIVNMLKSK